MADDPAEQQRKIEAKRDYNRRLSARKRQQVKDEITALAAKAEFHADRADQLEKKNRELLEQVRALSEANQQLTERVQVLTAAIAGPAAAEDIGLASGHPSTTAARGLTQINNNFGRPDMTLAVGSGGTAMMGGSSLEGGGDNQRYMQQLAGHLLRTTAGPTSHYGGGLLGSNNNSNSIYTPVVGRLMDNLASARGPLNLDLLIRLNSARNNNITNHISGVPNAGALLLGSSVAAAPRAVSAAPADSRITQFLAVAATERGNTNITSRDASSTTISADILDRLILLNQSSLSLGTGRPQSAAAAAAAGLSSFSQGSNQEMFTAVSDIEARERQRMLLALLERKKAEESTKWFNKPNPK